MATGVYVKNSAITETSAGKRRTTEIGFHSGKIEKGKPYSEKGVPKDREKTSTAEGREYTKNLNQAMGRNMRSPRCYMEEKAILGGKNGAQPECRCLC